MFDILQTWAIGLAAVLDTALLVVLLERRNRPYARIPIVTLLAGAWLVHGGTFLLVILWPIPGFWAVAVQKLLLLGVATGILLQPSAILHAALRFARTGFDLSPRRRTWFVACYLPIALIVPLAFVVQPTFETSILESLIPWARPFAVWASFCNLIATACFLRFRNGVSLPGAPAFLAVVSTLLMLQTALLLTVCFFALPAWPGFTDRLLFLCGIPSVAMALAFAYFLIHFNFFRLVMERAIVYGTALVAIALFHQLAFQEAAAVLPRAYRLAVVVLEAAAIVTVVAVIRPVRERLAEATRYLIGHSIPQRREDLRRLSNGLSTQIHRPAQEILEWFAAELKTSLEVDFVIGWLFRNTGTVDLRFGSAAITDQTAERFLRFLQANQIATFDPPFPREFGEIQNAGVSFAVSKAHPSFQGLILVGKHSRSRDVTDEEANAVVLLVEQLAVALENNLLVCDRIAAENRAGQLEKLSALGLMASAIAHEVKNPLSAIKTIAAVLAEDLGADSPHAEDVAMIRGEIDRLAKTTQQLLDFARPPIDNGIPVRVDQVISNTAQIMQRLASPNDIVVETRLADDLPCVCGDEATLREIFFNLVANSLDAAGTGGRVTVIGMRINGHVVIEVRDNGPGISNEIRERLFEPFVTSKTTGTGLGLYVVSRRVRELGGEIVCESGSGGTSFFVKIPVAIS